MIQEGERHGMKVAGCSCHPCPRVCCVPSGFKLFRESLMLIGGPTRLPLSIVCDGEKTVLAQNSASVAAAAAAAAGYIVCRKGGVDEGQILRSRHAFSLSSSERAPLEERQGNS